ncbi:uncharacterized protein V6R79_005781 [Siganus canaliculatus]
MPPKSAKQAKGNKSGANGATAGNKSWETGLSKAPFEEETWQACVSLVVGRGPEDEELIQALALAAQQPLRKLFSLLTWQGTLAKIHELGNPKVKKTAGTSAFSEVTEYAKALLDAGEEIPCDLMAQILKVQLLQVKAIDQQRREAEQVGLQSPNMGKGGTKVADKKRKSPATPVEHSKERKTKLKSRDEVDPPNFIDDEPEDGPQHYILVLGFYQPQLIGALDTIGVHVANVIKLCSEHIQSNSDGQEEHTHEGSHQSPRASPALDAETENEGRIELVRKLDKFWTGLRPVLDSGRPASKLHDTVELSYNFPYLPAPIQTQDPEAELKLGSQIFEGVASLLYGFLGWRRQHQHYLNNIKFINVPTVVILDPQPVEVVPAPVSVTPRSKKKPVPSEKEPEEPPPLSTNVDMRYYMNLLDRVPPEACSVPLILHCVLEQVVASTEQCSLTLCHVAEEPAPHSATGSDHQLVSLLLNSFLPLVNTEEERSLMLNSLISRVQEDKKKLVERLGAEEILKRSEQPLVIRHHDERILRLMDASATEGFDPAEVELSMMSLSVVWRLIHSRDQQGSSNSSWLAIKQQLQHFCADDVVSWPEVERLFHLSVFESMPLTSSDNNGILLNVPGPLDTRTVVPWDDPQSFAKQQLIKRQTNGPVLLTADLADKEQINGKVPIQLDLSDIQSHRQRSLFKWHHAEHHDASVFPQVLQLASEEYCCLDTFRGSHNNILYIFCHNPMSPYRQCKGFWDVALHTDVGFRKYLEHVADAISDWTKEEELKREAMQLSNVSPIQSLHDEEAANSAEVEDENKLEPVIRKESLKAWKMEQLKEEEVEMNNKSKSENPPKGKQQKEEVKSMNKKSKTSPNDEKKQIETEGGSASTPIESTAATVPPEANSEDVHPTEEPGKRFSGYSMDGKLIHVSGCVQHLFPSDGGHITVETIHYVGDSSLMKVTVRKDGHQFHTHINKVTSLPNVKDSNGQEEPLKEPVVKSVKQGSFSAVLDNGIHLSYSVFGPTGEYTVTPQGGGEVAPETSVLGSVPSERHSPSSFNRLPDPKSKGCDGQLPLAFSSLNLSVPNGLLVQFLRDDAQGVPTEEQGVLVRQSFPLHSSEAIGQLQDPCLSKERSRIITNQGAVIRTMKDGSTEILFADGSVSCSQDSGPVWVADTEIEEKNTSKETESNKKDESSQKEANTQRGCWLTTTPHGERICTVGTTHELIPTTPLLICKATDPITREVIITREDLVVTAHNSSRFVIAEHTDGTRITSLYQDRPNTRQHMLSAEGGLPGRETLNTTSECACGCTECVCVTRCADSVNENVHSDDTCEKGEEISIGGMEKGCGMDGDLSDEHVCHERESSVSKNDEESVFLSENGQKSASTKERVVLVEKEGCATVVMYPERHMAHVFLADATVITGNNQGAYQVFPSNMGMLLIQSDGKCVYSSDPVETTLSPKGNTPSNQPGDYIMSHMDEVACDITDLDGNHFQVMEDGQLSVVNFSPAPSSLKPDEEKPEEETHSETSRLNVKQRAHCPRLFLVHADGSGTELLSSHTVEEVLHQAYSDPAIAVLKEPLPDTQDDFAITILKPSYKSVWSKWLLGKQNPDITPPNLRNRSWHDFSRTEAQRKSPGPAFGTNIGHGLTLMERSRDCTSQRQPVRSCPKVLERREVYQHRPFTPQLRNTLDTRLKEYIERLMESALRAEEMKVKNPRTREESAHASELLKLVLSFAEEEEGDTFSKRHSEDIASLYSRAAGVPVEQSDDSEGTATVTSDSFTSGKESKWTERRTQHRQEIYAGKACREALRKNYIVPYFHPENIVLYQNLQQTPDMRRLSMDLPPFPKSESAPAFLRDAPTESTPRPLNPTPSQSASRAAGSDSNPERRPTNPTPQTAGEKNLMETPGQYKSVRVDVTGKPRKSKVRLPSSILSSKPCSVPNQQFLSVEEPVRRKCRTISLSNPSVIARGFQLLPSSVDFGKVQEGTSSVITVRMTNVGVDTCRFRVKQPPAATGLQVIYNPGPVAAGLHVELRVQLLAMSVVLPGEMEPKRCISHDVTIHTETDIIYLPTSYDSCLDHHTSAPSKKGSRVSQVPLNSPSSQVDCKAPQHPPNRSFSKKGTP